MLSLSGRLGVSQDAHAHRYINGSAKPLDNRKETLDAFLEAYRNNVMCYGYRLGSGLVKGTKSKAERIYELSDDLTKSYISIKAPRELEAVLGFATFFNEKERLRG